MISRFSPLHPARSLAAGLILACGMAAAQPFVPPAGMNLNANAYPPGAIQPPLPPTPPQRPSGPPPPGFNYQPPAMQAAAPKAATAPSKPKTAPSSKGAAATSKSSGYRPPAGKTTPTHTALENRVDRLEASDKRQDLRLGRIERDVGLLPAGGGGVADIIQGGGRHTVRPGDTLFNIAARHGTSVGELRALNHLTSDQVGIGTVLLLPEPGGSPATLTSSAIVHVVAGGETFHSLSRSYGVTAEAIANANPSAYPSDLRPGERLIIPNPRRQPQQAAEIPMILPEADAGTPSGPRVVTTTTASSTHIVRKGESLSKIAARHKVSMSTLMTANKIKNPNKILLGQKLVIPGRKITRSVPGTPEVRPLPTPIIADTTPPVPPPAPPPAPPAPPQQPTPGGGMPGGSSAGAPLASNALRGIVAYRVQRGDSLESVASLFSSTVENIRALNKHLGPGNPKEGTEIYVPTVGAVSLN